jgi:hypothetical protein
MVAVRLMLQHRNHPSCEPEREEGFQLCHPDRNGGIVRQLLRAGTNPSLSCEAAVMQSFERAPRGLLKARDRWASLGEKL